MLVLPDISGYCTRSLKRGAATAAVNSGSITSEQIDLHVGWKSVNSKRLYVEPNLHSRLAVSK